MPRARRPPAVMTPGVATPATAVDRVADAVRAEILSGALSAGEPLHAALGSEVLLFLLHVRPHYSLDSLVEEHRILLDEVQTRGPAAIREHLEHSTALLVGG